MKIEIYLKFLFFFITFLMFLQNFNLIFISYVYLKLMGILGEILIWRKEIMIGIIVLNGIHGFNGFIVSIIVTKSYLSYPNHIQIIKYHYSQNVFLIYFRKVFMW